MTVNWKQAIIAGVIMGIIAAGVVWYLERYELEQMHSKFAEMLESHADFQAWLRGKEGGESASQ